ncbi:MAG TPA: NTP transferase domain-containing protein, partial [Deltaproteobacteria bacterium]|nr:NTP transferase domain-containing protein [Deltaproteobacteria bacterium]
MTGVILMGGKSRRFGQDKVMATIGDKPLIEHVIEAIAPLMEDIILIGPARPGMRGVRRVDDLIPDCGPMGGIYTALKTVQ